MTNTIPGDRAGAQPDAGSEPQADARPGAQPDVQPGVQSDAPLSSSVGDYLKTIWQLTRSDPAATGDIAKELGVTAPSVTGMLGKMNGLGLVHYQPYRGAELTAAGRREALRLVRRHRLLETFMINQLGFGWDEVHAEAELMEHVVSDEFAERLANHLGQPEFDPHGDPIPRSDGTLPEAPDTPLAELAVGKRFLVHRVLSQDREVLSYLEESGIAPGAEVKLSAREPGGHLLQLSVLRAAHSTELSLSRELALLVLGKVV